MPKKAYSKGYWWIQIISWGLMMMINFWTKVLQAKELPKLYYVLEGLAFFVLAIITTHFIRNYFHKSRLIEEQTSKKFLRAFGFVIFSGLIFSIVLVGLAYLIFLAICGDKDFGMSPEIMASSTVNLMLLIIFWSIFYVVIKSTLRLRNEKIRRLELEAALKEAQLNTLKGQINPHFMFNSLNNIRGLILEDPGKSREMLTRMSEMLRASLNSNKTDVIPLEEEIQTVQNYIALSKIQMENRLEFDLDIQDGLEDATIPPMVLQLLVENAIKHGITSLPKGGAVNLKIRIEGDFLHMTVSNDGHFKDQNMEGGLGLKNIKDRLAILYGEEASFDIGNENGKVVARLIIPYRKKNG